MHVIRKDFKDINRGTTFTIVPIGDIHIGAAACDEARLQRVVERVAKDRTALWVGLGDYCDFISRSDPRFSAGGLAKWLTVADLVDLARAQKERFLEIVKPIASKCLALVEGNHETCITRHYERHIYGEIVTAIKEAGGFEANDKLALGYNGWLVLKFFRGDGLSRSRPIRLYLHHGFGGGKLAGGKALNMERVLWNHDADIVLMGHTHNTDVITAAIETERAGKVYHQKRVGAHTGTFLQSFNQDGPDTYSEVKGYFPLPVSGIEIVLRPGAEDWNEQIRIVAL